MIRCVQDEEDQIAVAKMTYTAWTEQKKTVFIASSRRQRHEEREKARGEADKQLKRRDAVKVRFAVSIGPWLGWGHCKQRNTIAILAKGNKNSSQIQLALANLAKIKLLQLAVGNMTCHQLYFCRGHMPLIHYQYMSRDPAYGLTQSLERNLTERAHVF